MDVGATGPPRRDEQVSRERRDAPRVGRSPYAIWRERTLAAAGVDARLAARLAVDPRFDLHELLQLVDGGCPPHLAARILAPLDGDRGEA